MDNSANKPLIAIDRIDNTPVYRQIYERFREAIAQGLLQPGDRVPSLRNLSAELHVARGTVETAYEMLIGEGYFLPRGQAGTVIASILQLQHHAMASIPEPKQGASLGSADIHSALPAPFQLGLPALDAFPRKTWAKLGAQLLKSANIAEHNYPDVKGLPALRKALAAYLQVSRGVACSPEQIIVMGGHRDSLNLISRAFLQSGDEIWMEDPGYFAARDLLGTTGKLVSLPVDDEGMAVSAGVAQAPQARLALVTPSHQSPLGVTLSLARRLELLEWAAKNRSWIVEDDYDGEYRYASRPLPALKSLDREDRVIYAGTLSKVLSPALRLAYLVVPASQLAHVEQICRVSHGGCPWLTQAIAAQFISKGHFSRHLKRMRSLYAERRQMLADALTEAFGPRIRLNLQAGGMHLLMRFNEACDDKALQKELNAAGLAVHALSNWTVQHDCGQGLLMGFTNICTAEEAGKLVMRLKATIDGDS
ncbi:MAG TPA: PLP-dependent aminotransferase family protein [Methylophilaceae bacterium]|nr:PLP-dependent aminotransferase family protein [Methylophilaceae bacterium]